MITLAKKFSSSASRSRHGSNPDKYPGEFSTAGSASVERRVIVLGAGNGDGSAELLHRADSSNAISCGLSGTSGDTSGALAAARRRRQAGEAAPKAARSAIVRDSLMTESNSYSVAGAYASTCRSICTDFPSCEGGPGGWSRRRINTSQSIFPLDGKQRKTADFGSASEKPHE